MASRSINLVFLSGNLTRNPEHTVTSNGNSRCTFGIATNTSWKGTDGNIQEITEFHNVVCWNKLADICNQYLKVGMKVFIQGEIRHRSWVGEDGKKNVRDEVKADVVEFLSAPRASFEKKTSVEDAPKEETDLNNTSSDDEKVDVSDLPF